MSTATISKVAIYARVSTLGKGQDVDLQLAELRRYATARGWEAVEYVDEGVSGGKNSRPALDKMMKAVKGKSVDAVVVWKMDRLGRSLVHLLHLLNEFQELGVAFVSLRESIDMTTAAGKLMAHLLGAFAEFEKDLIKERVKAGLENAKRKGQRLGRPSTVPLDRAKVIRLHLADPSLSIRAIAKKAKVSPATAQRILAGYREGIYDMDGFRYEGTLFTAAE